MSTAKQRLAKYRKNAEGRTDHYGHWKAWYAKPAGKSGMRHDQDNPKIIYVDSLEATGWRHVGDSHELVNLRHTGWYTDENQDGTLRGAVLQLPSRNGGLQYVPATYHTEWDVATVYMGDICDNKRDAARRADRLAEIEAEKSRDYYLQEEAKQQIDNRREEIHEINRDTLELIREVKGNTFTPAVCATIKGEISRALTRRTECFKRIKLLTDNYWEASNSY